MVVVVGAAVLPRRCIRGAQCNRRNITTRRCRRRPVRAHMPLVVVVGVPVGRVGVLVMVVAPVMPVVMLAARRRPRGCLHDGAQRNRANSITPRRVVVVMMLLTTLGA